MIVKPQWQFNSMPSAKPLREKIQMTLKKWNWRKRQLYVMQTVWENPHWKKDPCMKAFGKHVFNYLQSLKELYQMSQMSFQTRILHKLWLSPWTTSSTFLKIIQATLINIMKVNKDWGCQARKHHKTIKKVVIIALCDKQTKI